MKVLLRMGSVVALPMILIFLADWNGQAVSQGLVCPDNSTCSSTDYCAKEQGDCDGEGTCTPRPDACTEEFNPACGCDGVTYPNACAAAAAGVNVDYLGACLKVAVEPAEQTVEVGQVVRVDIVVSGLDPARAAEIVSTFAFDISFDPAILSPIDVTFSLGSH